MSGEKKNIFEVKWRIENVNTWFQTRNDALYSPQFLVDPLMNTRWKLSLSTNWHLEEKCLSLSLQRDVKDNGPEFIALNYELSFLACKESQIISKSWKKKFSSETTGNELKVKQVEILKEKKETFLPKGALTVCCKFWYAGSAALNGGQCSIRSVIGKKCIRLDGAIDNFNIIGKYTNVTVNFMSPSSDISFISFDVSYQSGIMKLERKEVKCKCFNWYCCKLYHLTPRGQLLNFCDSTQLKSLLSAHNPCNTQSLNFWEDLKRGELLHNGTLKLQLEIIYSPGVVSEYIEYNISKNDKVADESADLENVKISYSEKPVDPSLSESKKEFKKLHVIEKTEFRDEEEGLDAAEKRHFPTTTLKKDLISLYNDRLFCDTKLRTDTETFPAHRNVLSARSPVFKKMFTTDMKEAVSECINVSDISSDTVRRMLNFLYTDCTGDLEMQSAMDLYTASDKYDIVSLKQRCSSFMKKNLCPANVCDVLVLADMHQDKDLESTVNEYVLSYDKEVFSSDEWKLFMQNYSGLAVRVMHLIFRKNK